MASFLSYFIPLINFAQVHPIIDCLQALNKEISIYGSGQSSIYVVSNFEVNDTVISINQEELRVRHFSSIEHMFGFVKKEKRIKRGENFFFIDFRFLEFHHDHLILFADGKIVRAQNIHRQRRIFEVVFRHPCYLQMCP